MSKFRGVMKYIVSILFVFAPPLAVFYFIGEMAGFVASMLMLAAATAVNVWLAIHAKAALDVLKKHRESADDISDRADELKRVAGECTAIVKSTLATSQRARLSPQPNSHRVH